MSDNNSKSGDIRLPMGQQMAAACTGAIITSLLVTPFDVVKIRLQTQQKTLLSNKCFLYCNGLMDHLCACVNGASDPQSSQEWYRRKGHFTGTADAFVKIVRNEGVFSLWSGLSPTLVLAVPATVVYFVTYENLRLSIQDYYRGSLPFWGPLVAGASARVWSVSLVSPLELIRTKMQSKKISYSEMGSALKDMLHYQGYRGLFTGLGSTLLRDVPFSGIYWLSYETLKRKISTGVPTFYSSFMAGATAGTIAALITTPFDVVKTHQQIELGEKKIYTGKKFSLKVWLAEFGMRSKGTDKPKNGCTMFTVIRKIYMQNGMSGLFAGLLPRLAKVAPSCAIMISTFEYGKYFFQQYNAKNFNY